MPVLPTEETGSGSWQTPTVEDAGRKGSVEDMRKYLEEGQTSGCRLRNQVQMWPTPKASAGGPDYAKAERGKKPGGSPSPSLPTVVGGSLNPTWVEWLMGWPLGWTDCAVSGMDRFREWCGSHTASCPGDSVQGLDERAA
jgi:DNA (cytosine-5)-methyltransferase 1